MKIKIHVHHKSSPISSFRYPRIQGNPTWQTIITIANTSHQPLVNLAPAPACSLMTVAVAVPALDAVQLLPHTYPLGQQPPPTDAAQLNHPMAQEPLLCATVVAALPVGTATVIPFVLIRVVEDVAGQEVVSQFLPVRQQPPSYTAEQA